MSINATLIAQILVFAILVRFTMLYVWPVLKQAMTDRENSIAEGLAAAERGRYEMKLAERRSAEVIRESKIQGQELVNLAQRRAVAIIEQSKQTARAAADNLIEAARAQIERERAATREALRRDVAALAVVGAERILAREIDEKAHNDVLTEIAGQL